MYTQSYPEAAKAKGGITTMARNVEGWLDQRGKGAWIAAMVLGFIFVWPLGLAILAYMIWSKRMFGRSCRNHDHSHRFGNRHGGWGANMGGGFRSSGNGAFDAYREETIRRLMDEQEAFQSFLQRLRDAKDKTEFDAFMEDRAKTPRDTKPTEAPEA
ncbi:DUF2852 domain-containing protein [Rhodobacter sp. KR11]|uniref:DUF2852 domain-containing protein n=1 Tax=Rhodobacter sp. KR11 TaxID=2974588 RepID=UPI0039B5E5EE